MTYLQEAFFKVNVRLALVNWTLNYGLWVGQKVCDVAAVLVQDKVALSIYYTGCSLYTVFFYTLPVLLLVYDLASGGPSIKFIVHQGSKDPWVYTH